MQHLLKLCELCNEAPNDYVYLFETPFHAGERLTLLMEIEMPEGSIDYLPYTGFKINAKFMFASIADCAARDMGLVMVYTRHGKCEMTPLELNYESKLLHVASYYRLPMLQFTVATKDQLLQRVWGYQESTGRYKLEENRIH